MNPIMRKYRFASFENCSNSYLGTKLRSVYLAVWIELSGSYGSILSEVIFRFLV